MITIKLTGEGSALHSFFWELTVQGQMAGYAYRRLKEQARRHVKRDFQETKIEHSATPIEILCDCAIYLSAAGVISKILSSKGKNISSVKKLRVKELKELLSITEIPHLENLSVRNDFEHIDERLDKLRERLPEGPIITFHAARHEPSERTVLKRFNPHDMSISYLDNKVLMDAVYQEIVTINKAIDNFRRKKTVELRAFNSSQT